MREPAPAEAPRGLLAVTFTAEATLRLISTAYISEPAMLPLVDDEAELHTLERLEGLTSRRQDQEMPLPSGLKRSELLTAAHGYGYTYVNAAFCYTRASGNRFNRHSRGAWYAAWGDEMTATAQAEVCFHLTRELENTGVFENVTDYRGLIAGFTARMVDVTGAADSDFLDPDPDVGYPAGQQLADEVRASGFAGLIYPSVRREGGHCVAAFRTNAVQNIRQGATYRFKWDGQPDPEITEL